METQSELALFSLVAKNGSLSAAARELNVTPLAVSKRLAQLEQRLGVRLLNRTTRRLSLTNEGEVYLANGRRILADIEELERLVSSSRAAPKGLLRVNATLGFGRTYIAPVVSAFAKRYPEVEVQLQLTDRPLNLAEEAFDVGIRFGELPDSRLPSLPRICGATATAASPTACPTPAIIRKRVMAQDQVDVMGALGFERVYLVGHDRGGRVAYRLALDHPDRVRMLVYAGYRADTGDV